MQKASINFLQLATHDQMWPNELGCHNGCLKRPERLLLHLLEA